MMTGEMMRILDGPFGIADVTIENILCGRRNDVVSENLQRIRAITPAEVQRLAVKYLPRDGHGRGGRTGKRPLTGRRQFGRRHPIPARRSRNLLFRTKCVIFAFVPQGLFGKLGF